MKIVVTQDHIDNGEIRCSRCPVALALVSAGLRDVAVGRHDFTLFRPEGWKDYSLPTEAVSFIHSFDMHLPVQPFEFELEIA